MSHVIDLIDDYKDRHGQPSEASIARAIGVAPQTISAWRNRGIRELPARETMLRLAEFIRLPYDVVLDAALTDTGYRAEADYQPPTPSHGGDVRGA